MTLINEGLKSNFLIWHQETRIVFRGNVVSTWTRERQLTLCSIPLPTRSFAKRLQVRYMKSRGQSEDFLVIASSTWIIQLKCWRTTEGYKRTSYSMQCFTIQHRRKLSSKLSRGRLSTCSRHRNMTRTTT